MVTGDAVNAAARLQALAEPGTIVLGERTVRSVPRAAVDDLGALELKGKETAVRAFRLLHMEGSEASELATARGVPGLQAPMVGRDAEMAILKSLFLRVTEERRPSLVTVYGDAGVGKSRLTREFIASVERTDPPPLILRGRCLPYGDGVVYWPLAEILKGHAGVLDTDDPELAMEKVRKLGRELFTPSVAADPSLAVAALAYTIGLPDAGSPFEVMDPQQIRDEVVAAWRAFFTALAASATTVVVLEDIHWADPALLDLLDGLADRVEGPALFVCPSRPDLTARRPTWGGGRRSMSAVALDPLSADQAQHLIEMLLTVDDLPASVHDAMVARSEGNPFFLEEIIRRLIDDGSLVRDGDRWHASASIGEVEIPDTVQAVLASRIDLLDAPDKRLLQMAATVGRIFWTGPLEELSGLDRATIAEALRRLEDRELVRSRSGTTIAGEREYLFKHILTRDVAYESIPRRDRAAAHRIVAAWLEATAGGRAVEFAELLAYHYATAVDAARGSGAEIDDEVRRSALRWLLAASAAGRRRMIVKKAERLAEQAVELAADDLERTEAFEALGEACFAQASGDLAWRYFLEAMRARARADPPDGERVAYLAARAVELPQRWPGSMRNLPDEAEAAAVLDAGFAALPPGDSEARIRLLGLRAGWPFAYPDLTVPDEELTVFQDAGIEASELAMRMGLPNLASGALDQANAIWVARGLYGRSFPLWERRAELASLLTDVLEIGDLYAMGAWHLCELARYEEALAVADRGIDALAGRALPVDIHVRSWRLVGLHRLGRWDEALVEFDAIRALLDDERDDPPYFVTHAYCAAGSIYEARGERLDSDRIADIVRTLQSTRASARLYGPALRLWVERGEAEVAARVAYGEEEWRVHAAEAFEGWAELAAARGRWEEVPDLVRRMRAHADVAPAPSLVPSADRLEGRAALAAGERHRGIVSLVAASRGYEELGCTWERALTDLEIAEAGADDAPARAAAAAEDFRRLRTPTYLERTGAGT
jgi:hypothetical protein